jgi:hypothetical protein
LVVVQIAVSTAVEDEDFVWQLENCSARVLIVILDSVMPSENTALSEAHVNRLNIIRRLVARQDVWGGLEFDGGAGAFLYRRNRVADITKLGVQSCGQLRYLSVALILLEGYQNPDTAVAVGVCYRVRPNLNPSPTWPEEFIQGISEAVHAQGVRILAGIFDCPSAQAAALARSCGALPPCPFLLVFRDTARSDTLYFFHPAFIFVIGPANRQVPDHADQPERPAWLYDTNIGLTSTLVRATREVKEMPMWDLAADTFDQTLPHLGKVLQKVTNPQWQRPWIHQLRLYVGTARQGQGARRKGHTIANAFRK